MCTIFDDYSFSPSRVMIGATGNMHKNLVKCAAWFSSYASVRADRRTNRQTNSSMLVLLLITILQNPNWAK